MGLHSILVKNSTRGKTLADRALLANTSQERRTGLLKHTSLPPGEGLWIVPCEAIHTFGMKFPIDIVYLNRDKKVLKTRTAVGPRKISACLRAHSVLELPAGTLEVTGTETGDFLEITKL
jgi:uncharacterized membrane protein (UPF0127 family)